MRGVITLCLLSLSLVSSQNIELRNNGYENILISISDTVPYNVDLVPSIKELFNDVSAALFQATGFRAYFRNITILVPTGWNVPGAEAATTESFDKTNIRIDNPSGGYGDNPWVRQVGGCGVPGDFMHLTPKFLLDKAYSTKRWGNLGKVIVHEWGHLRWGLFDEYPIGEDVTELFYQSPTTNTIEASRCNLNVQGRARHRRTGAPCKMDAATSLYEPDCRYYPNQAQTKAISSLMYYHFLPSVNSFCDDDERGELSVHNYEAPSLHNRLCAGKSSWEVMRGTDDFIGGKNSAVDSTGMNTVVTFNVIQRRESRVVLVMDISGSMGTDNYYIKLNAAARRYLLYTVPTGASVGLVKYSSTATKLTTGLRKISSAVDRDFLANLVPLENGGGTAIGEGLLAAKQLLEANGGETKGSRIILLTDGKETTPRYVADVQPQIRAAGITVDTILLSTAASNVLISLAADTGGLSFYSSGDSLSTSLNDAFTTAERARISNPSKVPITIESRVVTVPEIYETCYNVMVDNGLGVDTTFTFSWVNSSSLRISLTDSNNMTKTVKVEVRAAAYQCPGECAVGKWTVCINNPTQQKVNMISQVESTSKMAGASNSTAGSTYYEDAEDLLPVTVRTNIVNGEPSFNKKDAKPVSLFATVSRGYSPVIGAQVVATIESPSSAAKTTKEMRDDGAGADIVKDDGTYSAYIMNSEVEGKHTVSVNVLGTNGTNVKKMTMVSSAGAISEPGEPVSTQEVKLVPTDEFQRYSLGGFISVKGIAPPGSDFLAPSRILDLKVTEASYEESRITLEWTAVGDDLDSGNASSYEVWKADSHKILYKALENATQVNETDVVLGKLSSPSPAHSRERLVINISDKDRISVYAIMAKDEAGNASPLSNIVSVKLVYVPLHATTDTSTSSSTTISSKVLPGFPTSITVAIAIGSVSFIVILLTLVILICQHFLCKKTNKKNYIA